jgi:hypothetical protein
MSGSRVPVPPFKVLAAALRRTTEHLARELASPTNSAPDWNELEWAIARAVAAMQGTSVLLASHLRWTGPPAWRAFLVEQREQCVLRDARIGALLDRIDGATRERQIGCVALKGSALRGLDIYEPGERPMGDVDLLVEPRDLRQTAIALASLGYVEAYKTQRHGVYALRQEAVPRFLGEHVDNPLKIDVHVAVGEELPIRHVDITKRLLRGRRRAGISSYPDLASLLLHLLLHAAGNMRSHTLRQIQLHDIAIVARLLYEEDWGALLDTDGDDERRWWVFPPLALTARYYPDAVPATVLDAARSACPPLLRTAANHHSLTRVSLSNLRIHALPGITWSRTPLEALRFIRSRVLPSRRSLAQIEVALPAEPQLEAVPWYRLSHGSRIVRWLFTQPPRVQTMASVRASLERDHIGAARTGG